MTSAFERLERHDRLGSTNVRMMELARAGAPPFTAVMAREQTEGKGRGGKGWHSPRDAGLWLSVLLPPPPGGPPGVSSLAVGVAVARALEETAGVEVGLKWPNDLFAASLGAVPGLGKVGGVLCESVRGDGGRGVVAGVGVNLRCPEVPDPAAREALRGAAFLEQAAGRSLDVEELATAAGRELRRWADPPPDRLTDALREEWDRRDLLRGLRVVTEMAPVGVAVGLDPDGSLRVSDESGRLHRVRGGSVRLADEAPVGHGRSEPSSGESS